jgi:ABC-2 type transport system permease protein
MAFASRERDDGSRMSVLVMPPMILFSGTTTPPESMPRLLLLPLMYAPPLYHYANIMYGILVRGNGIALIGDSVLALTGIGTAIFGLGMWRFKLQFR